MKKNVNVDSMPVHPNHSMYNTSNNIAKCVASYILNYTQHFSSDEPFVNATKYLCHYHSNHSLLKSKDQATKMVCMKTSLILQLMKTYSQKDRSIEGFKNKWIVGSN